MMAVFIKASASDWQHHLTVAPHDFYAKPCFAALDARWQKGVETAFYDEDTGILIPLLRRPVDADTDDCTSPYGYPGIVVRSDGSVLDGIQSFVTAGRDHGLVTTFIRLHPILNHSITEGVGEIEGCTVMDQGMTVSIGLDEDHEAWFGTLSPRLQRDVNYLIQRGYSASFHGIEAIDSFIQCYHASMHRVGAAASYFYDRQYVTHLFECLGDGISVCVVRNDNGALACAGLFVHTMGIVQYHLSGTHPDHQKQSPSKLMLVAAREWARSLGAHVLHLGGGVGGSNDGLLKFKRRFGTGRHQYRTLRVVHDCAAYQRLSQAAGVSEMSDGFFPAYRRAEQ